LPQETVGVFLRPCKVDVSVRSNFVVQPAQIENAEANPPAAIHSLVPVNLQALLAHDGIRDLRVFTFLHAQALERRVVPVGVFRRVELPIACFES